jgi:hypothetical protein
MEQRTSIDSPKNQGVLTQTQVDFYFKQNGEFPPWYFSLSDRPCGSRHPDLLELQKGSQLNK